MNNVVSDRIKKAIEKSGYSFVELEKRTGVSKSALQRYSQGVTTKVPVDVVNAIVSTQKRASAFITLLFPSNMIISHRCINH